MARKKKETKIEKPIKKEEIIINEEEIKEAEIINKEGIKEAEIIKEEEIEAAPKKIIRKGSKVIVRGRLFGDKNLTQPMYSVKDYEAKIINIYDDSYEINLGFIKKNAVK